MPINAEKMKARSEARKREAREERLRLVDERDKGLDAVLDPTWAIEFARARRDVAAILGVGGGARRGPLFTHAPELFHDGDTRTPWLLDGLVTCGAVCVVGGEPKSTKTWCALEMGMAVATATPAFGRFATAEPRPVCALLAESTRREIRNRLRALAESRGIDAEEASALMHVAPLASVDLGSADDLAIVVASARMRCPDGLGLLILDPLRDLHRAKENDSDGMAVVMRAIRCLRDVLACAVVVVHHSAKQSADTSRRRPGQSLRGSSAVHAALDCGLYLHDVVPAPGKWTSRVVVEVRNARGAGAFTLSLEVDDDAAGEAVGALWTIGDDAPRDRSKLDRVIASMSATHSMSASAIAKAAGVDRTTATKYVRELLASGRASKDRSRWLLVIDEEAVEEPDA